MNSIFGLRITPIDFWHRHYLVCDLNYHKLGTCDFIRGIWYFSPIDSTDSFMGFTRDDAILSWKRSKIPDCAASF